MNPFDFNRYPVSDPYRHWYYARDFFLWFVGVVFAIGTLIGWLVL